MVGRGATRRLCGSNRFKQRIERRTQLHHDVRRVSYAHEPRRTTAHCLPHFTIRVVEVGTVADMHHRDRVICLGSDIACTTVSPVPRGEHKVR